MNVPFPFCHATSYFRFGRWLKNHLKIVKNANRNFPEQKMTSSKYLFCLNNNSPVQRYFFLLSCETKKCWNWHFSRKNDKLLPNKEFSDFTMFCGVLLLLSELYCLGLNTGPLCKRHASNISNIKQWLHTDKKCNLTYLATSSLPSTCTCAFINIYTSSPVLTGRRAQGCKIHARARTHTHTHKVNIGKWHFHNF